MGASAGLPDNIPAINRGSATTVTLAATTTNGQATRITIGGQQYRLTTALTMTTSTSGINGIDTGSFSGGNVYNIYAVASSGVVGLVASLSATPTGFTAYAFLGKMQASSTPDISHVMPVGSPFIEYTYNSGTWNTDDSTSFAWGTGGALMGGALTTTRTKAVQWRVAPNATDKISVEVQVVAGIDQWFDIAQNYPYTIDSTGSNALSGGAFTTNAATSTTTVQFARYKAIANDDSPLFDWPSNVRWRVTKTSDIIRQA